MKSLRILSLLPAATEMIYLLGLEKSLVGVSHECDYPPEVKLKPKVTSSSVSNDMSSEEIDSVVSKLTHQGPGVFHIKKDKLKKLKPNLIITQELCKVCAIPFTQVQKAARILEGDTKIISLEPESVEDILENILLVGEATGSRQQAKKIVAKLEQRLNKIATRTSFARNDVKKKPRVLVIEWLDPVMVAGHWVPEMVELSGGKMMLIQPGKKSLRINLAQKQLNPDILIISPCGFDIKRILQEKKLVNQIIRYVLPFSGEKGKKNSKVYLVDGNSYMTRPGPRIIDGIEILAEILHPEIFPRKYSKKSWYKYYNLSTAVEQM